MRHYARELERAQSTIEELEKRKNVCEAGMAAMEACWNQVGLFGGRDAIALTVCSMLRLS